MANSGTRHHNKIARLIKNAGFRQGASLEELYNENIKTILEKVGITYLVTMLFSLKVFGRAWTAAQIVVSDKILSRRLIS